MKGRTRKIIISVVSVMTLTGWLCVPVWGQVSQRGYSSRGVRPIGSRSLLPTGPYRPSYNRPSYPSSTNAAPVNSGGPLNFGYGAYGSGQKFDLGSYAPYLGTNDVTAWNNMLMQGAAESMGLESTPNATPSARPSIRPRLDVEDHNAMNSNRVLQNVRNEVEREIAKSPIRPFSSQWYAMHAPLGPASEVSSVGGNAWTAHSWDEVSNLTGINSAPKSYDFRPDDSGVIYVYRNHEQLDRAVDARKAAVSLAQSAPNTATETSGLSLGVFALVPPVDQPVKSLVHLVVDPSGIVSGYQYDFATDSAMPVHGMIDRASQRVAWSMGHNVLEAGLANLTNGLARSLVFRPDGWVQPWILMRVPASATAKTGASKSDTPAAKSSKSESPPPPSPGPETADSPHAGPPNLPAPTKVKR